MSRSTSALGAILVALSLTGAVALAQGEGQGVEVRLQSAPVVEAAPGRIVSLSFRIISKLGAPEELFESLELPDGWQALAPPGSFPLPAQGGQVRLMGVAVPRSAAAGRYQVTYAVQSRRDPAIRDTETAAIIVSSVSNLVLLVEQVPPSAMAGESYEATLRAINRGNVAMSVTLSARPAQGYAVRLDPQTLNLAAGESRTVQAHVQTDPGEPRSRKVPIEIVAAATGPEGKTSTTAALLNPEIIPRQAERPDLKWRVPARIGASLVHGEGGSTLQATFSGEGYLDEAETRHVAFLLRGPDAQRRSSLGHRDEYWASYDSPRLNVDAGDQVYGLSYLTEYQRYGRGLQWRSDISDQWSYSAMGLHSRWHTPKLRELGAAVAYEPTEDAELQFSFLRKDNGDGSIRPDGSIFSLQGRGRFGNHAVVLEGALSTNGDAPSDTAYRLDASGRQGSVSYLLTRLRGGPDFSGYFTDAEYTRLGLSTRLSDDLDAHAGFGEWDTNLDLRPERGPAPREQLYQAGLSYRLSDAWYLAADWDWLTRADAMPAPAFNRREFSQRYGVGYTADRFNGRLDVSFVREQDRLTDLVDRKAVLTAYLGYRPRADLFLSAFGSVSAGGRHEGSVLLGSPGSAGFGINWLPSQDTRVAVSYSRYGLNSLLQESDQLWADVTHHLRNGHEVSVQARRNAAFTGPNEGTEYILTYTIPFGIAVGKRTNVGELRGRLVDADANAAPLDNIVVTGNNGLGAVATGKGGRFSFGALPPGTYMLQILPAASGPGRRRVPTDRMPLVVQVKPARTTELQIGMVAAGQVRGRLALEQSAAVASRAETGAKPLAGPVVLAGGDGPDDAPAGIANTLVELTRDDQVLRTTTDRRGDFLFDGLRPGNYRLKVAADVVPVHYRVEQAERDLEVTAGADVVVTMRVVPTERRVRMVDAGSISNTTSTEPAP